MVASSAAASLSPPARAIECPAELERLSNLGRRIQTAYLREATALDRAAQRPVVSVFTTTYRTGTRIRRAFQSLRRQRLVDWEWVILDDSPDQGEHFDLLRTQLLVGDNRVRIFRRNGNNGSIGDVKNECIGLCRGRYLMELDHDDELTPDCLADCAQVFQRDPAVGFVYTDFANLYEHSLAPFRYPEFYGLGLAGYYCRHISSAHPLVSKAGAEADRAFQEGITWVMPQYASVTPQLCPAGITHLVALPNHPRMWRRTTMEHMGSYPEFLPICDDQEILMRTQACGAKMVKLHTVGYLQYMNADGNFSGIRGQEICRMGSAGPLYKLFQEAHPSMDRLFMDADCDPDMRRRSGRCNYLPVWGESAPPPVYYNGLEHPDCGGKDSSSGKRDSGVVVYLGMAAVVTNACRFLEDAFGPPEAAAAAAKGADAITAEGALHEFWAHTWGTIQQYATPLHGATPHCDEVVARADRRRRRVVYVMSADMDGMATLKALTDWVRQVRPGVTEDELLRLRAYGFVFSDPKQRELFADATWTTDQCLQNYARHMYAADAEFVLPNLPPPMTEAEFRRCIAEADAREKEDDILPADLQALSNADGDDTFLRGCAFGSEAALAHVFSRRCRILNAPIVSTAAEPAAEEPPAVPASAAVPQITSPTNNLVHLETHWTRLQAAQTFVDPGRTHYLEIGVETGQLFNALRAKHKTGVDPAPPAMFAPVRGSRFCEQTSDAFFADPANAELVVHVAFVDGMHLAEYVARDIANASAAILRTLQADPTTGEGWLLLDDVLPRDKVEQHRVPRGAWYDRGVLKYGAPWTGDVWKTAAALIRARPELPRQLFVYQSEYRGVLALRLTAADAPLDAAALIAAAEQLDWDRDFAAYRAELMRQG